MVGILKKTNISGLLMEKLEHEYDAMQKEVGALKL